ncbi:MAG: FAD-dependent thymidylate synthase [Syntrophomonadaceae bacterium]|nr:FAD-dependent thymidylate synthase [Syntrophomonadaceae bacterium]
MQRKLHVKLLQHTWDPETLVAAAARLCYSSADIEELVERMTPAASSGLVEMLLTMGHESPIEHVSFTFGIEGVSRSLLAQLTRHRIASYSVKSQRWVRAGSFAFVVPPEIEALPEARRVFLAAMEEDQKHYDQLVSLLYERHLASELASGKDRQAAHASAEKRAFEDARYVLPNACETKLVMTMNARSLHNFFRQRCCNRAQWEIREMAEQMLRLVRAVAPTLFGKAGPACVALGRCPEGKMTCGRIKEVRARYRRGLQD